VFKGSVSVVLNRRMIVEQWVKFVERKTSLISVTQELTSRDRRRAGEITVLDVKVTE
jgi:hypothetical protein